jgi:hypothetical protein
VEVRDHAGQPRGRVDGTSRWITGNEARASPPAYRLRHDHGRRLGTVLADDVADRADPDSARPTFSRCAWS